MNKYELYYIISSAADEAARSEIVKKFNDMIVADGGEVISCEEQGLKKFAYEINRRRDGYYVLVNFTANPELILKMEKQMSITEHFVRKMVIKK